MSLDTFANLKTAISDHLDRSDLDNYVEDFITLAEARHKRDIRIQEMLTRSSLTVDDRYVDLPTGLLEAQTIRLLTDPVTPLTQISIAQMTLERRTGTGKPLKYTIHAQFEFDIDADQSYSGEIVYYKAQTALSDSNTSNDILTRAPDAYLYGALCASAPFLLNDERIQVWNSLYRQAVDGLSQASKQGRYVGPLISRAHGSNP